MRDSMAFSGSVFLVGVRGGRSNGRGRRAEGFLEGGGHFQLDGGENGGFRERSIGEGLTRETSGDLDGARGLAEGHFLDLRFADRFEKALGGEAKLLSGIPFLLATFAGAPRPMIRVFPMPNQLRLRLLAEEGGIEGSNALAPAKPGRPSFDGGEMLAQFVGDLRERTSLAEGEIDRESSIGARRFAEPTRKVGTKRTVFGQWRIRGSRRRGDLRDNFNLVF